MGRYPQAEPKLSPEATEKTIYVRHNEAHCPPVPSSCFTALVTAANDTAGNPFGGKNGVVASGVKFTLGSPDMRHVVLSSEAALTPQAGGAAQQLYEWTAGLPASEQIKLVSLLPASEGGGPAVFPEMREDRRNGISEDGSKVFFTAGPHLYMRDTVAGTTVRVDEPEEPGLAVEGGDEEAVFKGASPDGSTVFFSDPQRLTKSSGAVGVQKAGADLYARDTVTGTLTDLTAAQGASGNMIGSIEFSSDAKAIAFVAQGVLDSTPNATGESASPGTCPRVASNAIPGSGCNLYIERDAGGSWQAPQFVARLSSQDESDWRGRSPEDLGGTTMRMSPDGRYLTFMSQRPLTGYENRSLAPQAEGARTEEVFLYDAEPTPGGRLRCVCVNPSGNRPTGSLRSEGIR